MNHHHSRIHYSIVKRLLHCYTHCGDHSYQYFWVPVSLYVVCSYLICGNIYINLTGGRFTTGTCLSESMIYFLNSTMGICSIPSVTNSWSSVKDTSVDAFSKLFYLHDSVDLLYCDSISHSRIIPNGQCHIINWYCKKLAHHLCTTWVILASDSNNFLSPLQLDITVNSATHKYFLIFPMSHLTAADSPTKPFLGFYSGDTFDLKVN